MDYLNVFTTFLALESGSFVDCQERNRKLSDFTEKILICGSKMNESLTGE